MSKTTQGAENAPLFAYLEKGYFKAIESPNNDNHFIVVNFNGTPMTENDLPASRVAKNRMICDALGSTDIPFYYIKSHAEAAAKELNDRTIAGFDIGKYYEQKEHPAKAAALATLKSVPFKIFVGGLTLAALFSATQVVLGYFFK